MTKQGWMVVGIACMVIALAGASRVCADEQGCSTVEQAYPVLASGILKKAVLVEMDPGILLTSEGVEIKASRITEAVETADPGVKEELEKNRYDENGDEVFRHVGFYAEPEVLKQLAKLGVE